MSLQPILKIIVRRVLACLPEQQLPASGLKPASEGHRRKPNWSGSHTSPK